VAVPDQRRTAPFRFALHRIRDAWFNSAPMRAAGHGSLQPSFAKFLQHAFAQEVGIALAGLGKLDHSLGDHLVGEIGMVAKAESDPRHFECHADNAPGLEIGPKIVKEKVSCAPAMTAWVGGKA
jgi:hypothetical protein